MGFLRDGRVIPEHAPVGESQANGAVESAIKRLKGQIRTMELFLENKIGVKVEEEHQIWEWMVEFCAETFCRYHVGADGFTALKRLKGREPNKAAAGFGERVLFRVPKPALRKKNGMEPRWEPGVLAGFEWMSNEYITVTERGAMKTHTIAHMAEEDAWNKDELSKLTGTPLKPMPGRQPSELPCYIKNDGNVVQTMEVEKDEVDDDEGEDRVVYPRPKALPRKFFVKREDVEQ